VDRSGCENIVGLLWTHAPRHKSAQSAAIRRPVTVMLQVWVRGTRGGLHRRAGRGSVQCSTRERRVDRTAATAGDERPIGRALDAVGAATGSEAVCRSHAHPRASFRALGSSHAGQPCLPFRITDELRSDPTMVAGIAQILRTSWDADGGLVRAASTASGGNPAQPRTYEGFALSIARILGAGGSEAEVSGYLRREEERLLGVARLTGQARWLIAQAAWRAVRGISPPPGSR
jgi:hypothetical protein